MKKILTTLLMYTLISMYGFAATEFNMSFSTAAPGGVYNPNNVVAVWVTQTNGTIVKTILRYGETRKTSLSTWNAADGASADGKMGATRANHSAPVIMTATWDLKNKSGVVIPDGTYKINLEMTDGTRKTHTFDFVKDGAAGTRTNPGTTWFTGISIAYAPPAPANTAPVAQAQSVTNAEDTAKAITLTATDAESNSLTYAVVTSPIHGMLSGTPPNVTYTPATNYYGSDSFIFQASDGSLTSTPAMVSITVTPVNDPPVSSAQSLTATDGNPLFITLNATDAETNAVTYNLVSQPVNGHLLGTPPSLTYVPVRGLRGSDSFMFNANDGTATGNTATVSITLVFIDSSSNGIPDSWKSAYGVTDANADSDGDGESNYAEYMAGTDPTNKTSVFAINVQQIPGSSNVVFKWSSVQYHFYAVQAATNLVSSWSTLTSNNIATPPQNVYTGTYKQAVTTFYRIRLEP